MKIAFFSETGNNQRYMRDFPNARTEVAWCLALDAPMCSLSALPNEKFDLGIVIIPKNNPNISLDFIRGCCDKVAVMQEGPHWYFQDYQIDNQFHYFNTLMEADWVYCHNISDIQYYKGLGCKDVRVMRSLMIPEGLVPRSEWGDVTMIGGNSPSMGRKQKQEDMIEDIHYLPYLSWRDWIMTLGDYNIGVHLMRTHAAGTFAMNCAFHGIPCIGYYGLDTQEFLHPTTSVNVGDLEKAKEIADKLRDDSDFYDECSKTSKTFFKKFYTEEAWKHHWNKQFIL